MADGLKKVGVQLTAEDGSKFNATLEAGDKAFREFGRAAQAAGSQVDGFGEVVTGAARRVGELATDAIADAGKALVGFGVDSISLAGDFEQGMLRFGSVTGKALEDAGLDLEDFEDKFLELGAELPVSTSAVQEAAINLAKGGVAVADIMADATEATLNLAAAGEVELAPAADLIAKQLGVWGDKAGSATNISNKLAQAANASTVGVEDLALGLANSGGSAKLAGVEFDDLVQTMALVAPGFSSAADAGTSLKTFISRLIPTTKPATEAMIDLGLATSDGASRFYDATGSFIGMEAAAQLLHDQTKGLSEEQKSLAFNTIFGSDAIRAAAAIAEAGSTGFNAVGLAMDGAGTAAEQAGYKQQGFNTSIENAKGSLEAFQIEIGQKALPVLGSLIDSYIVPGINAFKDFALSIFEAEDPMTALAAKINEVLPGFTSVATFIGDNLNPILAGLATVIASVVVPAIASMVIAAAPLILTIGAIGLAGATLYKAWTEDWGGIQTTLTNFWTTTGEPIFNSVTTWLSVNIPAGIQTLSNFWNNTLLPALNTAWNFFQNNIIPILQDVYAEVNTNLPKGIQVVSDFWNNTLMPALTIAYNFVNDNVIPILTTLATGTFTTVNTALDKLAGYWNDTLLPAITASYNFINDKIVPLFVAIVDVNIAAFNKALDALAGFWKETLLPAITSVYTFIKDSVIPIFSDVETDGLTPVQTASTVLADLWNNTFYPALKTVSDFVGGALTSAFGGLGSAIDSVTGFITDLKNDIASVKLPDWMTPGSPMPLETAYRGLGDAIKGVADTALPKLKQELQIENAGMVGLPEQSLVRPPASFAQMMSAAIEPAGQAITNNFNLTAQYQNQPRPSLIQDVRTLQALYG